MSILKPWKPNSAPQQAASASSAFELLFGGAAGPGKSTWLVMEALRQITNPAYNGIIFRRNYPMLTAADGILAKQKQWYPRMGGEYREGMHYWTFPSGARIYVGHLIDEGSLDNYQGAQYSYVGFDEICQFTETMYLYLFSRVRADLGTGLRGYIRAAGNPGGIGHQWVKRRFVTKDIRNKIRWFTRDEKTGQDSEVARTTKDAKSRTFIPALGLDNPNLDPEYLANLRQLDPVEYKRLAYGDWDADYQDGKVYPDFSSVLNVSSGADYDPRFPVMWGIDDGYAEGEGPGTDSYHPRVVLVMQLTPLGGINVFAEYYKTKEADYLATIDRVMNMGYPRPEIAWVDTSAAMFRGALASAGIMNGGATHSVSEGLRYLRTLIKDENNVRLLQIHPRCEKLIEEMNAYTSDASHRLGGTGEPMPFKRNDHGPDALRYAAFRMRHRTGFAINEVVY